LFQKASLEHWVQEYRGDLGIALTDVIGKKAFLADFDQYFAKLFDGLRQTPAMPASGGMKCSRTTRSSESTLTPRASCFKRAEYPGVACAL